MIDHTGIGAANVKHSSVFYDAVLGGIRAQTGSSNA